MNSRALFLFVVLMLGLIAFSGCSTDNNEHQRLVAEAALINDGNPMIIAAVNEGDPGNLADDFTPIEFAHVLFSARPLNDTMVIPEGGTYSTFNVTHYDLTWVPEAGAPAGLTAYNVTGGNISVSIPVDDEVMASVLVGTLAMKSEAWFPATPDLSFTAALNIVFWGHESGSEHEVGIPTGTTVLFVPTVSDQ